MLIVPRFGMKMGNDMQDAGCQKNNSGNETWREGAPKRGDKDSGFTRQGQVRSRAAKELWYDTSAEA